MTKDHNTEQAVSETFAERATRLGLYDKKLSQIFDRVEELESALSQVRGNAQEPVATVRVRHKGYSVELSTYVAYALPEGLHDLYAAAPQVAQEEGARIRGFERSLASVDAYDPQSFIDGAKWAEKKLLAAPQADAQQSEKDVTQIAALIFTDPDGGRMHISSTLTHDHDGTMRFTVKNPETGRRFGVYLGLVELKEEQGR
ncbi:MAG TPA: hypothetical protein VJ652_14975 [Noviherbaspirillum sp.]|nr:hypothetical protein [Noviherbaspirillum sp.]